MQEIWHAIVRFSKLQIGILQFRKNWPKLAAYSCSGDQTESNHGFIMNLYCLYRVLEICRYYSDGQNRRYLLLLRIVSVGKSLKIQMGKKVTFARVLVSRNLFRLCCFCFIPLTPKHASSVGQGGTCSSWESLVRSLAPAIIFYTFEN